MPGSIENVAPELLVRSSDTIADAFLSKNQTGLLLEFGIGSEAWQFEITDDCRNYGFAWAALALCIKDDPQSRLLKASKSNSAMKYP